MCGILKIHPSKQLSQISCWGNELHKGVLKIYNMTHIRVLFSKYIINN